MSIIETARLARNASIRLAAVESAQKNRALEAIRRAIADDAQAIFAANQQDLRQAEQEGLSAPLLKRLKFDQNKIDEACAGIDALIRLEDPVGRTLSAIELDTGLELYKVTCPIGVIGVIFESRPD
ncbi:MAG TPA: hypothetical protein PK052_12655, partial [Anaerohalosphaeraceae bacterium]|nr:hypothetical protein [Anaerohalosphaeraceae bacterium]